MRTKTLALSAMLGLLGGASAMAGGTNVYSMNAVGYINVVMPPGFSIITCPLIVGTDTEYGYPTVTNDLNVVLNNDNSQFAGLSVYQFLNGVGFGANDFALAFGGWENGGNDVTLLPGQAVFVFNPAPLGGGPSGNLTNTFVGTVPQGSLTNQLAVGYNLVGSIVPTSGDVNTNSIMGNFGPTGPSGSDQVLFFDPTYNGTSQNAYGGVGDNCQFAFGSWSGGTGANGDPVTTSVSQGFFYYANAPVTWVENFTINP